MDPESRLRPLHLASRNDVEGFLTTLASSPGITAWQVEQATDALTLLLGSVLGQVWVWSAPMPGQILSRIIAIPWPTPTHMVHRA